MKVFNAIQLVILFMCLPFLIAWLHTATFPFAGAAFWAAICGDVVMIGFTTHAYAEQL